LILGCLSACFSGCMEVKHRELYDDVVPVFILIISFVTLRAVRSLREILEQATRLRGVVEVAFDHTMGSISDRIAVLLTLSLSEDSWILSIFSLVRYSSSELVILHKQQSRLEEVRYCGCREYVRIPYSRTLPSTLPLPGFSTEIEQFHRFNVRKRLMLR
jgi:hypothetical protein